MNISSKALVLACVLLFGLSIMFIFSNNNKKVLLKIEQKKVESLERDFQLCEEHNEELHNVIDAKAAIITNLETVRDSIKSIKSRTRYVPTNTKFSSSTLSSDELTTDIRIRVGEDTGKQQ